MNEGQNGTGGLNANGNAGGFFVPGNSMAPTGLSALPNGSDSVVYAGDNGKQRKSKKWLIGAILVGVLLIAAVIFVVVKHTDIVDKIVHGGKMSNEELAQTLDQANLELNKTTKRYNNLFTYDEQKQNRMLALTDDTLKELESDYDDAETELSKLPVAEETRLDDEKKQEYAELYTEIWKRFNTAKDGLALARQFNEAFLWSIVSVSSESDGIQPKGQDALLNNDEPRIAKVAKEFDELYRLFRNNAGTEAINQFFNEHSDIVIDYYDCYTKVDDPDDFYGVVGNYAKEIKK